MGYQLNKLVNKQIVFAKVFEEYITKLTKELNTNVLTLNSLPPRIPQLNH